MHLIITQWELLCKHTLDRNIFFFFAGGKCYGFKINTNTYCLYFHNVHLSLYSKYEHFFNFSFGIPNCKHFFKVPTNKPWSHNVSQLSFFSHLCEKTKFVNETWWWANSLLSVGKCFWCYFRHGSGMYVSTKSIATHSFLHPWQLKCTSPIYTKQNLWTPTIFYYNELIRGRL